MTKSIKYIGVSGEYTKNGTPKGFMVMGKFIVIRK